MALLQDTEYRKHCHDSTHIPKSELDSDNKGTRYVDHHRNKMLSESVGKKDSDPVTNPDVRHIMHIPSVVHQADVSKIQGCRHVMRMEPTSPQPKTHYIQPKTSQPRGKPVQRWRMIS